MCMDVRGVHLEVVFGLDTDLFLFFFFFSFFNEASKLKHNRQKEKTKI